MKITPTTHKVKWRSLLLRWTAFIAAVCSMLALLAVLTGWRSDKISRLVPPAAGAQGQYYASNVDMAAIFRAH